MVQSFKFLNKNLLFIIPRHVELHIQIEGDRIRIKDQLYEPENAKQFLLQQKSIAQKHGTTSFQLRAAVKTGNEPEQILRNSFMRFGADNLDSGMTWTWSEYISDWQNQQQSSL